MRWEDLFADLEAQAVTLGQLERSAEVEERVRAESARLMLGDRLRANTGRELALRCTGGLALRGALRRTGSDWLLLQEATAGEALVPIGAVHTIAGLGRLSSPPGSETAVAAGLGLRSMLRGVARDRTPVQAHLSDGTAVAGTVDRVGADFVEFALHAAGESRRAADVRGALTVASSALVAVRRGA